MAHVDAAVTGANGHLGGLLVRELLARGQTVRAIVYGDVPNLEGLDVELVHADVRNLESVQQALVGADVVYNLAGRISLVSGDEDAVREVNVGGVGNVVAASSSAGVRRLVHFSSIHAYEHEPPARVIDESVPLVTRDAPPYSISKADGQRVVEEAVARGEIDAVVINPAGCIGPYDYGPSAMGQTILDCYTGRLRVAVTGGFSWVDGRDVAAAAIAAGASPVARGRYLVAGHWLSVSDTIAELSQMARRSSPRLVLPMWVARATAPLAELYARTTGQPARFTEASLHALRYHESVDDSKARRELGHNPRPLPRTLQDTVAWFDEVGMLSPHQGT